MLISVWPCFLEELLGLWVKENINRMKIPSLLSSFLVLSINGTVAFADSQGNFPGKGNANDYNRSCPLGREATECGKRGDLDRAIELEKKAISIYPYDSATYHNLGIHLKRVGKLEEGIKAEQQAIMLEPHYVNAWFAEGQIFEKQHKLADAEQCYRRATELDPNSYDAVSCLGDILRQQGKYAKARPILLRAKNLPGGDKYPGEIEKLLKLTDAHQNGASN